jgi:predicted RNase H-like nuclease (RuvC/YqgF family)
MDDALKDCEAEVERLEAENQHLRRSAEDFGTLAERLNRTLRDRRVADTRELEHDGRGGTSGPASSSLRKD